MLASGRRRKRPAAAVCSADERCTRLACRCGGVVDVADVAVMVLLVALSCTACRQSPILRQIRLRTCLIHQKERFPLWASNVTERQEVHDHVSFRQTPEETSSSSVQRR